MIVSMLLVTRPFDPRVAWSLIAGGERQPQKVYRDWYGEHMVCSSLSYTYNVSLHYAVDGPLKDPCLYKPTGEPEPEGQQHYPDGVKVFIDVTLETTKANQSPLGGSVIPADTSMFHQLFPERDEGRFVRGIVLQKFALARLEDVLQEQEVPYLLRWPSARHVWKWELWPPAA